jgi:hypothetical protein
MDNEDYAYRYNPDKIDNMINYPGIHINLAKDIGDVALLLLISLQSAASFPMIVTETEVHEEISNLAEAGQWDELALKGLKWIQQISQ